MTVRQRLLSLVHDRGGVAVMELALAAPFLACMVIGVADLSNAFSRKMAIEQGAQRAIEKAMQTTTNTTAQATIAAEVMAQANVTADKVQVEFQVYCDMVKQADGDVNCDPGQKLAKYTVVTVNDKYQPMFPITFNANADGSYHLEAKAGMRTQ